LKIGIISDIHGNAEALKVVLNELKNVDRIVCLGDIVGYGADPEYCIKKMRKIEIPCVKGNHESAVTGELDLSYFNDDARRAAEWTKKRLKEQDIIYLSTLSKKITIYKNILGVHGSPRQPLWEYVLDKQTAEEIFKDFDFQIYFIGHSHIAGYFSFYHKNEALQYFIASYGVDIFIRHDHSYIINCGSVGQPRDGNPRASFVIFDTAKFVVHIKRIDYPVHKTQEKINRANLPQFLAERLALGI
jgi:predicted phosphodiesterase